jgi:hypothetical protein
MINQRFGQGVSNLSTVAELRTFDGILLICTYITKLQTRRTEPASSLLRRVSCRKQLNIPEIMLENLKKNEKCNHGLEISYQKRLLPSVEK